MGACLLQLSFTGSPEVGKLVAAAAARSVVPCTLELVSTVASYCCAPACMLHVEKELF
jgi:acyl-CoA reductase-like NAD-dependent aldehyde dehydrogenase